MNILVSVIIPAYNASCYIKSCVNSVLDQTYTNFEIIIVNDGSKDDTAAICAELATQTAKIRLFNQENQGVSVARNKGLELSKGEYILFLDADDALTPNAIQDLLDAAEKHHSDLTIGMFTTKKSNQEKDFLTGVFDGFFFLEKCLEDHPITHSACRTLYKHEFIQELHFPIGYVANEDGFFNFLCAVKKPKVVLIESPVYVYTIGIVSASRSAFTTKKYNDINDLLFQKEKIISEEYSDWLSLFYHLKVKTQITLLISLANTKGYRLKNEEKEAFSRFNEYKDYFRAELPRSRASIYNFLVKYGYNNYRRYSQFKAFVKRFLKK